MSTSRGRKRTRGTGVEGFAAIVEFAQKGPWASLARNGQIVDSWREYPSPDGHQAVEWDTARVPRSALAGTATFAWTCVMGAGKGPYPHHLHLNGSHILAFETPLRRKSTWRGKGCTLRFACMARTQNGEAHGIMRLTVPGSRLEPDAPARLRVVGGSTRSENYSFFNVLGFTDTVAHQRDVDQGGMRITSAGRPTAVIRLSAGASDVERFAARELQRYVENISGARLAIRTGKARPEENTLQLGTSEEIRRALPGFALPELEPTQDSIAIKTSTRTVALAGSTPRSTLTAVYRFLQILGCRWIEPGPCGEIVPRIRTLRVRDLDVHEVASFKIRTARPTEDIYLYTEKDVCHQIDWMAKHGMNWFQFLIPPYERMEHTIVREMRKRGMTINVGIHNFRAWLPDRLFGEHPEYFAEIGGKRKPRGTIRCASNRKAVTLWAKNAAAWARRHPDVDEIAISCDDGTAYCQCEGCRHLRPIEQLQIFYNAAARAIHKVCPGKPVMICSYGRHYEPSQRIRPYTRHVSVEVDTFARCQGHALNAVTCTKANTQIRDSYNTPEVRSPHVNRYLCLCLRRWLKTFKAVNVFENLMLHGRRSTPFPYPAVLARDMRYYHDIGVVGFLPQADLLRWGPSALDLYVTARLSWNVELSLESVLEDFFRSTYGRAAGPMRKYFERLERRREGKPVTSILAVLTTSDIERCHGHLEQAARLADTRTARRAVRRARLIFEHTSMLWKLQQAGARCRDLVDQHRQAAARRERAAAVSLARQWSALARRHMHENMILFSRDNFSQFLETCLNHYPDDVADPEVNVGRLVKHGASLATVEDAARSLRDRQRAQAKDKE